MKWFKRTATADIPDPVGEREELRKELSQALRRLEEKARLTAELQERLEAVYQRMPAVVSEEKKRHQDMERLLVLAGLREDDPLWKTVLSYADEHERNESQVALGPGLSDGDRQYAAGRAASASDFASALRDLRVKAALQARKERE